MFGQGKIFDEYLHANAAHRNFYERYMNGEKIKTNWVLDSDYEPKPVDESCHPITPVLFASPRQKSLQRAMPVLEASLQRLSSKGDVDIAKKKPPWLPGQTRGLMSFEEVLV